MDELAWAGAVRGAPIEVVRGEVTGLPIPAHAEIAIEGFIDPVERRPEGPYGEAYGYYSERVAECPFVTVERIYYRDDPIILGCPQGKPPHEDNRFGAYLRSTLIREQLEAAGVPNVTGVWIPPEAGNRGLVVVAVKQSYPGHATQAATVASQAGGVAYLGRYTIVVDDDIDIYDMDDVWWAILTRVDPVRDVQIYRRGWAGPLDQATVPGRAGPQLANDHRRDQALGVARAVRRSGRHPRAGAADPRTVRLDPATGRRRPHVGGLRPTARRSTIGFPQPPGSFSASRSRIALQTRSGVRGARRSRIPVAASQRVRDRRGDRVDRRLTAALGAVRPDPVAALGQERDDIGEIRDPREPVVVQVAVDE